MDRTDFEPWKGKEVAKLLALVENQRRYYQDMVSALPVGLVVLSANRSVVSSNRAFRQAFGVRGEDLRGKTIEQILPSDRLIENIRNAMVHGIPQPPLQVERAGKLWRVAILPLRNWGRRDGNGNAAGGGRRDGAGGERSRRGAASGFAFRKHTARWFGARTPCGLQFTAVSGGVEPMLGYPAAHWLKTPNFFAQRIHQGRSRRGAGALPDGGSAISRGERRVSHGDGFGRARMVPGDGALGRARSAYGNPHR